jgi:ankyrin repeat protein
MNNAHSFLSRFCHSRILHRAAVLLVALACSGLTGCTTTSAVHEASKNDDLGTVKRLLKDNPSLVSSQDKEGDTPLYTAAFWGHKDAVLLLLANNADVNARNKDGATPLHTAAYWGHKDVVLLLLDNKADVNAKDNWGDTPLRLAADKGHKDVVELLRQHGGHE